MSFHQPPPAIPGAWSTESPPEAAVPRWYPQLLRGPRYAPWRGVLAIIVAAVLAGISMVVFGLVAVILLFALGAVDLSESATLSTEELSARLLGEPLMFLANNLILASLIPIVLLTTWACFGWRPRWASSVAPGIRWGWLGLSFLISLPFFVLLVSGSLLLEGDVQWQPDDKALVLVAIILLTTPLQAAGEEYMFRGLLTQSIGSWFARPLAGVAVSAVVSGMLFGAIHSLGVDQDIWLFLGRALFGMVFSYLTWQTGGLEAAISVHAVNNMALMVPMALTGGLGQAVAATEGSPLGTLVSLAVIALVAGLLVWVGRRLKLATRHDPALQPGGPAPAPIICWPPPAPQDRLTD